MTGPSPGLEIPTAGSAAVTQNGNGSIPADGTTTVYWYSGCANSEITISRTAADNWNIPGMGTNPFYENNLTSVSSTYNNTTSNAVIYYTAGSGDKTIGTVNAALNNFILLTGTRLITPANSIINPIASPCANGDINLTSTLSAGQQANVISYDWEIANITSPGTIVASSTASANPGAIAPPVGGWIPGATYQVRLRLKEFCCGWSIPMWATFTVATVPPASGAINGPAAVCPNTSQTYFVGAVAGATGYTWTVSGGSIASGNGTASIMVNWGSAGSGSVQVLPFNPCGNAASATTASIVIEGAPVPTITPSPSDTICAGGSTQLTVSSTSGGLPGNGTYTYVWSTTSTNTFINVSPGASTTYSVVVTEGGSACSASTSNFVTVAPLPVITSPVGETDVLCNGGNTGTITISVSSGTAPFEYSINNGGTYQSSNQFNGLGIGSYNIIVKDTLGCSAVYGLNPVVVNQPNALSQTDAPVDASCANVYNGSITITASGGVTPYSYNLNGGPGQSGSTFTGLAAATYTAEVIDKNGCTDTADIVINNSYIISDSLIAQTNVNCYGGANGSLTVSLTGGTPPYSYSINGTIFQSIPTFTSLSAANYIVTLRDSKGCTDYLPVTITQPAQLSVVVDSAGSVQCSGGASGSIFISVSGGTPPYKYLWSNNDTTQNVTGLATGTYTVTVQDSSGCSTFASGVISQPLPLFLNVASFHNPLCYNDSSGYIDVNASGGVPPYSFTWSNTDTTQFIYGLNSGTYSVTVHDANACQKSISQALTQPSQITTSISTTAVTCAGSPTGSATLTVNGGTPNYTFQWNNGDTSQNLTNVAGGGYYVIVRDANGCTATNTTTITQPTPVSISISGTNITCFGDSNGTVSTIVNGGTGQINYTWNTSANTPGLTGVPAGTYSVVISDANSCTASAGITLTQPAALVLNATPVSVACNGGGDGYVDVTVNGGVFPYSYLWSTGDTTENVHNLNGGTYYLTTTDANSCSLIDSFVINEPPAITSTVTPINASCNGFNTGGATLVVNGGTPNYTFEWSNFSNAQNLANVGAGTYYVIITDAHNCTHRDSAIITQPAPIGLSISGTNISCNGGSDGTVSTVVTGGTGNIGYLWNTNATSAGLTGVRQGLIR